MELWFPRLRYVYGNPWNRFDEYDGRTHAGVGLKSIQEFHPRNAAPPAADLIYIWGSYHITMITSISAVLQLRSENDAITY